ncbi:MAG: DUF1257 domain-containing protein [Candidatus Heimdallarchaeota archaeon]|nr:MAG: DUF1257 domain-containing protein [Candidatus Heimdallarchaeota archaeon]
MSRYCKVETEFKNESALIAALMETQRWTKQQIEVHSTPKHLFGYTGDKRKEIAHIIIRRKHVGSASNDLGFIKNSNGQYEAIVSQYDKRRYGENWFKQLKGNYAFHALKLEQEQRGRRVVREFNRTTKKQLVRITGYR